MNRDRIIRLFFSFGMIMVFFYAFSISSKAETITSEDERILKATQTAKDSLNGFGLKSDINSDFYYANYDRLDVVSPFIIFMVDRDDQDEIYEFPVYDKETKEIVFIAEVFSVDGEVDYLCEFSSGFTTILNNLKYIEHPKDIYVYKIGMNVYFEYNNTVYNEQFEIVDASKQKNKFFSISEEEKRQAIMQRTNEMMPAKFEVVEEDEAKDAIMHGILTLYNPRLQYGYGMCWACAVATVYNYLYTASITGFDVCNAMNIGYNTGGTITNEKDALNHYGVVYNVMRYANTTNSNLYMKYSMVTNNINSSYPVILNGYSNYGNHAVTIYGYTGTEYSSNNISIFDSSYSTVSSGKRTFTWSNGYFVSNGTTFYKLSTLSKYSSPN